MRAVGPGPACAGALPQPPGPVAGLVGGAGFAVDASVIEADASRLQTARSC